MLQKKMMVLVMIGFLSLSAVALWAVPVNVGSGTNAVMVYIEWSDNYVTEFLVAFDTVTITGLEAFDIIEADTAVPPISDPLTTVRGDFGFGVFIDGISQGVHSDIGYGGGENWWHFWIKDSGQGSWASPAFGVADRILSDGDSDGWVYGHAAAPAPEPMTLSLLALGLVGLIKRRRMTN